jgi:hypothetical protein
MIAVLDEAKLRRGTPLPVHTPHKVNLGYIQPGKDERPAQKKIAVGELAGMEVAITARATELSVGFAIVRSRLYHTGNAAVNEIIRAIRAFPQPAASAVLCRHCAEKEVERGCKLFPTRP